MASCGRKRDPIWNYFEDLLKVMGKTGVRAKCIYCHNDSQGIVTRLKNVSKFGFNPMSTENLSGFVTDNIANMTREILHEKLGYERLTYRCTTHILKVLAIYLVRLT